MIHTIGAVGKSVNAHTIATAIPPIVWIIVLIVYQQAENHLLQPIIYRTTVNVPPIVVIISILIGASLLGVLGALLAIPVAATVQILLRDWWERRQEIEAERHELGEAVLLDAPEPEPPPAPAG